MPTTFAPFADGTDFLEEAFRYLTARSRRLTAQIESVAAKERERSEPVRPGRASVRDACLLLVGRRQKEEQLKHQLDARLHAHRKSRSSPQLGLDALTAKHKLSPEEQTVLIICAVCCFGQRMTEEVLGSFNSYCGSVSVLDCIDMLAPASLSDRLQFRAIFDGTLVKAGLIELSEVSKNTSPAAFLANEVRLSAIAYDAIVAGGAVKS